VGEELVDALLASGHYRWHDAASRQASADAAFRRARAEADHAMGELVAAEDTVTAIADQLDARAGHERALRAALEALTTARAGAELRRERLTAEAQAMARDQLRLAEERRAVEAALVTDRAALARPLPDRDVDLEAALSEAERELTEATAEVAALRAADRARDLEQAAIRRAAAARVAEAETAGRRLVEAEKRLAAERAKSDDAARRLQDLERTASEARSALEAAAAAEAAAIESRDGARDHHDAAEAAVSAAREMAETRSAAAANSRARLQALRASLSSGESDALARVARSVGGRRLDESLSVEPDLRAAVGAALADSVRAWVVSRPAISSLRPARGTLVVDDQAAGRETDAALPQAASAADREFLHLVAAKGGGSLATAIRRDPLGTTTRLLWPVRPGCRTFPPAWTCSRPSRRAGSSFLAMAARSWAP
jgi:chromosome segregation protein